MPELKDWIVYGLTLISIIVTSVFSFMVWKVSKASAHASQESAKVAQLMYELNRLNNERQEKMVQEFNTTIRAHYTRIIVNNATTAHNAMLSPTVTPITIDLNAKRR